MPIPKAVGAHCRTERIWLVKLLLKRLGWEFGLGTRLLLLSVSCLFCHSGYIPYMTNYEYTCPSCGPPESITKKPASKLHTRMLGVVSLCPSTNRASFGGGGHLFPLEFIANLDSCPPKVFITQFLPSLNKTWSVTTDTWQRKSDMVDLANYN